MHKPLMGRYDSSQCLICHHFLHLHLHPLLMLPDICFLFSCRPVKINVVLMRTEASLSYQFRRKDFFINRSAHIDITLPLCRCAVIWRCCCQCNHFDIRQFFHESLQCLPPLTAKVMCLIQTNCCNTGFLYCLKNVKVPVVNLFCFLLSICFFPAVLFQCALLPLHGTVQCLISRCSHLFHLFQIIG